tara:strand:- start:14489 stop:14899 length:411 start_codon:yes stop_codon:yes gene_type:complete
MDKSFKGVSKSFTKSVKSLSNMDGMNVVLFVAVIAMILNSKMLKPMVASMPGKLGLVLFICFLAMTDRVLGLLGVVLFMSVNNGLIEGMAGREGNDNCDEESGGCELEGMDHEEEEKPKEGMQEGSAEQEEDVEDK